MAHYGVSYTTVAPKDFYEDREKAYLNADCYQGDFLAVCVWKREKPIFKYNVTMIWP